MTPFYAAPGRVPGLRRALERRQRRAVGDGGRRRRRSRAHGLVQIGKRMVKHARGSGVRRSRRNAASRRPPEFDGRAEKGDADDPRRRRSGHPHRRPPAHRGGGGRRRRSRTPGRRSTMFRGIEIILKGRDPRDAWVFTQRICGVCTTVHAIASIRAVENAIGAQAAAQRPAAAQPDHGRRRWSRTT